MYPNFDIYVEVDKAADEYEDLADNIKEVLKDEPNLNGHFILYVVDSSSVWEKARQDWAVPESYVYKESW